MVYEPVAGRSAMALGISANSSIGSVASPPSVMEGVPLTPRVTSLLVVTTVRQPSVVVVSPPASIA